MAVDSGRSRASHSAQVCVTCKARKKRCDKVLPSCGYCVRKGLGCGYQKRRRDHSVGGIDNSRSALPPLVSSHTIPSEPATLDLNVFLHVQGLIRETGQFVDDVTTRYFQGFHQYLPVVPRTRFHKNLITLGAAPSAGYSVLLLSLCLIISSSKLRRPTRRATNTLPIDTRSLHLATKSLFAQLQGLVPPSVPLIQAGILLAVYEYTHGQSEEAFASIAGYARMAYAARIHQRNQSSNTHADADTQMQAEEAANTWWGIVICERIFFCEVAVKEQPLISAFPTKDSRLPTESKVLEQSNFQGLESVPYVSVSNLSSANVGSFGRAAQASWILDQVLQGIEIPGLGAKLTLLRGLDTDLHIFLGAVMQHGNRGAFCEAIAIAIRALFALHGHILAQFSQKHVVSSTDESWDEWCKYSYAALDTTTKMVLEVAVSQEKLDHRRFPSLPPSYSYIVRAALQYIYRRAEWKDESWVQSAEEQLRISLEEFNHQ
ncbi:Fc.00g114520.m01.CDS01 [Cosmosporella sp. VM-42]